MENSRLLEYTEASTREFVTTRALSWLENNLSCFNSFSRIQELDEFSQTSLAELALLCYQVQRRQAFISNLEVNSQINRCLSLIENVYRSPLFHEYVFRGNKYAFTAHLLIWLSLIHRQVGEIVSKSKLQWLVESSNIIAIERLPFRTLELRYFLDLGGFHHTLPTETELFKQTFLGSKFELVSIADSDIYSITHTIFYLTDFGLKPSSLLEGKQQEPIRELLKNLLGMMLHAKHWDLVAELILAYRCLDEKENLWIHLAWKALLSIQTGSGMIYGSNKSLETVTSKESLFQDYYHRTLVTVMAGLLGKEIDDDKH